MLVEAQIIKTQREKLRFNLEVRKAKQSGTGSYLNLSPKWQSCLQKYQMSLRAVSSHFIILSIVGIKALGLKAYTAWFLWQLMWLLGLKMCVTAA